MTEDLVELPSKPLNGDSLTIVSMLLSQLSIMEQRLTHQMTVNTEAARTRWKSHEQQHEEWERDLKGLGLRFNEHLRKEEQEDIILQARLGPMKNIGNWLVREWRTIVIVLMIIANFVGQILDRTRML